MALQGTPVYTGTLTSTITITATDGVFSISVLWVSGTVTITGGATLKGSASTAITLSSTNPSVTIGGDQATIDSLTINASAGNCLLIAYY